MTNEPNTIPAPRGALFTSREFAKARPYYTGPVHSPLSGDDLDFAPTYEAWIVGTDASLYSLAAPAVPHIASEEF